MSNVLINPSSTITLPMTGSMYCNPYNGVSMSRSGSPLGSTFFDTKLLSNMHNSNACNYEVRTNKTIEKKDERKKFKRRPISGRGGSWLYSEVDTLYRAIEEYGEGNWTRILQDPKYKSRLNRRTNCDLKDKWYGLHILSELQFRDHVVFQYTLLQSFDSFLFSLEF